MSNLDILNKYNFKFNKCYGQNFIFDKNFLKSIVNETVTENDTVLEIGAGAGTLTSILSSKAKKVISFEIDKNLEPILNENLKDTNNVKIIFGDILKSSMQEIEDILDGPYILVANLPYYITTPIIFKFLENSKNLKMMVIMVQEEVAQRIVSKPGTKEYGAITPAIDYRGTAKIIKKVNRNMFTPSPNVDSAIVEIKLDKNKYKILDSKLLDETIKCAFAMRRKTLENNIKSYFNLSSETTNMIIKESNLSKQIRGEKLTTEQLIKLSEIIKKYI